MQDNHDHGKTDESNADIYTLLQTQQGCECVLTFIQFIKPEVTVFLIGLAQFSNGNFFIFVCQNKESPVNTYCCVECFIRGFYTYNILQKIREQDLLRNSKISVLVKKSNKVN